MNDTVSNQMADAVEELGKEEELKKLAKEKGEVFVQGKEQTGDESQPR